MMKFDFTAMLQVLSSHRVDFIVIGGVGAAFNGIVYGTSDLDIVHSRKPENLERLLAALQELDAHFREPGNRRIRPTLSQLASPGHQLLKTKSGALDALGTVNDNQGYEELFPHTILVRTKDNLEVRVVDLPTLIQLKEAAGRDKDKAVLPLLRQTLDEKQKKK